MFVLISFVGFWVLPIASSSSIIFPIDRSSVTGPWWDLHVSFLLVVGWRFVLGFSWVGLQSSCSCSLLASESSLVSDSALVSVFALAVCSLIIVSSLSCLLVSDSASLPYFLLRSSSFQLLVLVCLVRGRLGSVSCLLLVAGQCFVPGFPRVGMCLHEAPARFFGHLIQGWSVVGFRRHLFFPLWLSCWLPSIFFSICSWSRFAYGGLVLSHLGFR